MPGPTRSAPMKEAGIGIGSEAELPLSKPNGPLPLTLVPQPETEGMLRLAIERGAPIDTIERVIAMMKDERAHRAETEFNEALNRVQAKIARVAPDLTNSQTNSKYASYAAIDRVIRPIYSEEGFSLSFTEEDCPKPEHVRIICLVSKGAYTRQYRKDMPADGKGAKGGDVMTKTHAAAAADSYAKRYLVKDIFNVAIGADDDDGNMEVDRAADFLTLIKESTSKADLAKRYNDAIRHTMQLKGYSAKAIGYALGLYKEAAEKREKDLKV